MCMKYYLNLFLKQSTLKHVLQFTIQNFNKPCTGKYVTESHITLIFISRHTIHEQYVIPEKHKFREYFS